MTAIRSVDHLGVPRGFAYHRREAQRLGVCARCGFDARFSEWTESDRAEYGISAICPTCWLDIFGEDDDDDVA